MYGADDKTCGYFSLHATADVYHSRVWRNQLERRIAAKPESAEAALDAAEKTALMLWQALDGIEARRLAVSSGIADEDRIQQRRISSGQR